ncbi:ILVBL [Bugula neritina]|uniref:2-hydroxyacyl-CoA lyase 2 n=1 Tax=Bugula neritina TaxID=10212 RepID=A0A7J7IX68_BUGNE|nr:ILVBL [Bugula neritina]
MLVKANHPGPVFVEFPIDVLYNYKLVMREVGVKQGGGFMQKIVNSYLQNYVNNIFSGAWESRDTTPLPVDIPMPSLEQVNTAAAILSKAKTPVIVIGSQTLLPPTPADQIRQSLEVSWYIPCTALGSVCDFRLSYGRSLNRKAKIIAVNRDKGQLWRNSDMFWKPTVAVQADAGTFIVELQKRLGKLHVDTEWVNKLKQRMRKRRLPTDHCCEQRQRSAMENSDMFWTVAVQADAGTFIVELQKRLGKLHVDTEWVNKLKQRMRKRRKKSEEETDKHLNPLKILQTLEEEASDNTLMVADGGDFVGTAAYILRPRGPLLWLDPGAFGTLGVGGGFALGAKLCRPDCDVVIIYGDGSLGYSVAEFDTFTRHKTPVVAVVGNDAGWTQISREQVPMFGSNVACGLEYSSYELVAKGYGGDGLKIDRSNQSEMREIFKKAFADSRSGKSILLNCLIGKTNFREGSISV